MRNSWRECSRKKKYRMCLGWGQWSGNNITLMVSMSSLQGIPETHPCLNKCGSNDSKVSTRAVHHGRTSESSQEDKGKNRMDLAVVGDLGRTLRTGLLSDWML